jgi:hypothetical protein
MKLSTSKPFENSTTLTGYVKPVLYGHIRAFRASIWPQDGRQESRAYHGMGWSLYGPQKAYKPL